MSTDWILVDLAVPNEYYRKHTDLSYIFMLWGKKRLICPVKFMKRLRGTQTHFVFQMPKWWINQNNLRKFILDDDMNRVLFPPVIPIEEPMPLLDEVTHIPLPTITIAEATAEKVRRNEPRRLF